jgi:CheY-specific phosphatase CheX
MQNEITLQELEYIVVDILQEAAFVFAEPSESSGWEDESLLVARLGFKGPASGEMILSCNQSMATDFAANLLGVDPDDPDAVMRGSDALGEMLNIVGGTLLANWFGVNGDFEMEIPSVVELKTEAYTDQIKEFSLWLPLETDDGERIDVAVRS